MRRKTDQRQIVAMGGAGFSMEPENLAMDRYIVDQAGSDRPAICFLPHATDDSIRYSYNFYKCLGRFNAKLSTLSLFTPSTNDIESFLLDQDIIYVGGGNTKSMLALWREWGLDRILRKAYENGTLLAGISAGANCWFEEFSTDSIPGTLTVLPGIGILKGSFCPHYDGDVQRRPMMHEFVKNKLIQPGYAADNGAAAHFVDGKLSHAVTSRAGRMVFQLDSDGGTVIETAIPTNLLSELK